MIYQTPDVGRKVNRKSTKNIDWQYKFIPIINDILNELEAEGEVPSIRGMWYILVSRYEKEIPNDRSTYGSYDHATVKARRADYSNPQARIAEDAFVDNVRGIHNIDDEFITGKRQVDALTQKLEKANKMYSIPRWHGQPNYVETWLEKDAVVSMFRSILRSGRNGPDRELRIVPNRGWTSRTFVMKNIARLREKQLQGKTVYVQYWGDYDPSGLRMAHNLKKQLAEYDISNFEMMCITKAQIEEFNLEHLKNPLPEVIEKLEGNSEKKGDPNAVWFKQHHGDGRVFQIELDAMQARREQFKKLLLESVDSKFDISIFEKEVVQRLSRERKDVDTSLEDVFNARVKALPALVMADTVNEMLSAYGRWVFQCIVSGWDL